MRTKNSLINIIVSLTLGFVAIVIGFISQKFFVEYLGLEYLGLNALFTNIISMLSVVELGMGSAVVYHLYKPLKENDNSKVSSLMTFYKIGYRIIALTVLVLGIAVMPFLRLIVGDTSIDDNIYVIYGLFVLSVVVSYLLTYKRSILYADQKNYLINIVHISAIVMMNIIQIAILIITQNFYLYLIVKVVMTIVENIIISKIVDKRYELNSNSEPLDTETKRDIFRKIKGLLFHKAGGFLVLGSTNIIISILLGIKAVGMYSNYLLIETALIMLFSQMSTAITASIGNLLLGDSREEHLVVFKRLQFAMHSLTVVSVSVFFVASASFVTFWIGEEYVFPLGVLAALTINVYMYLIRTTFYNFKTAAGIFYEDRYVPLFESAVNIIASVILIHFIGIAGAFIGTALSSLALHGYSFPKFVYKGIFGRSYTEYTVHLFKNLIVMLIAVSISYYISSLIHIDNELSQLVIVAAISTIVPCVTLWIIYRKSSEYVYFKSLILKMSKKVKRKIL